MAEDGFRVVHIINNLNKVFKFHNNKDAIHEKIK